MEAHPTLDQLQVLIAIVDNGSFSAAARQLNRAQSVVSYAITNLEDQLQLTLFDRSGSRRPVLTEAGKAILEEARRMVADLDLLRGRAVGLRKGLEGELSLAISMMVPEGALIDVLKDFQETFPTVRLKLHWGSGFMVNEMVAKGEADLGVGGALMTIDDSFVFERLGQSFILPVAAPAHPLAQINRPLSIADVRNEVQIVVSDNTGQTKGKEFNVFSKRIWRVTEMTTKHVLLRAGLGWGGLHTALVDQDLREGRLVALTMEAFQTADFPIFAFWRTATPPGPTARWIMERFRARLAVYPQLSGRVVSSEGLRWERGQR